jgi:LPS-assembly lipoprotein
MLPRKPTAASSFTTRRVLLQFAGMGTLSGALAGCGFRLRGSQAFAFQRIAIQPNPGGAVAQELRRAFGSAVQVLAARDPLAQAQLVLNVVNEEREKIVVGVNTSGQVRELQLRMRVRVQLSTAKGKEIIAGDDIMQQRDISYSESAALAKEAEEALLYRDMQSDIVQQILRRLAVIQPGQLD